MKIVRRERERERRTFLAKLEQEKTRSKRGMKPRNVFSRLKSQTARQLIRH